MKFHEHDAGHMTKMAAMSIYEKSTLKHFKKSSIQEPVGRFQQSLELIIDYYYILFK